MTVNSYSKVTTDDTGRLVRVTVTPSGRATATTRLPGLSRRSRTSKRLNKRRRRIGLRR